MIRFFAGHRTAANLVMLGILALGLGSITGLRRETFPETPPDEIEVSVVYLGAAPEDVEDAVCRRIEDALDGIEDVAEVRAEALESLARVTIEVVEGADVQVVFEDVKTEVEAIDDLPERAEAPVIRQLGRTLAVASIAVTGDMPQSHLKAYCEDLKNRLLRDPEIEFVTVKGFSDHQIRIEIPAAALMQFGVGANDVARTIREQSVDLPTGTIETRDGNVIVRFTDERRTPLEFEDLVVLGGSSGAALRLGDLATIRDTFELDEERFLYDGQRAGLLEVKKTRAQDALDVVDALSAFVEAENSVQPESVRLHLTQDSSSIVRDRLQMLVRNGWQGLLLVFLSLWLFFSFRLSFWVAFGLPVSFLGALFFMTLIGYSINMITMVALLLALGLLMDDGIVLAENIATHLSRGKGSLAAAVDGTREVAVGVFSSFATTVVVFGPLAFLSGDIGAVLKVLPVVLILVLAVSLVEAFLILPGHLAHSMRDFDPARRGRFRRAFEGLIEWLRERVLGRAVDRVVEWRYLVVGLVLFAFLLSVGMFAGGVLKFQAFPAIDGDVVIARVLLPQGTPLGRTEATVTRITDAFGRVNDAFRARQPGEADLSRAISVQFNFNADAHESGPHVATVTVDLLGAEQRDASIDEILNAWRGEVGRIPDVLNLKFGEPFFGPAGNPIEIRVSGEDLAECSRASREIQDWLLRHEGVYDVMDDLRPGKPEVRARLIEGAASLGVNAEYVAGELRSAILGTTASEIQVGPESYEIDVRLAREDLDSLADLESFHVSLPNGAQVPIDALARLESGRGHARIARVDGRRTVTVIGNVDSSRVTVAALMKKFQATLLPALLERHPGVQVSLEGEIKNGEITQASLQRAFLIGMIGVFLLLSFQFRSYVEPLVVMCAIPMCLIGVIWGHLAMGLYFTLPSVLGFVSLAGVVVNDSILLVEFIKIRRRAGDAVEAAARAASRLRFRAVLLTSLTTVAGMLPLLSETSLQAQVLIPLATSIVFGLLASTILVLLVIPAAYTIVADFGRAEPVEDGRIPATPPPPPAGATAVPDPA
ncbi:MAG: efflux RND transporter permease subunit [Planctomycetota bacterium]|jgi:multidrug efflux pump subunit AcrB